MRILFFRRRRAAASSLLAIAMLLATTVSASAGRPDAVDPSLMSPPLNPSFDWECWRTGSGIVCDGERTTTYTAVEALPCPGGWIYATGSAYDTLRRVGDADGRALSTLGTTRIDDQLSLSPEFDGIVGRAHSSWTDAYDYPVPGELASRTVTRRGVDVLLTVPGQGLIVLDAGIKSWDIDNNLLFAHGPHPLIDDIEGVLAATCDALSGG
ncbi:MAG TPA: hypothetical protein VF071_02660 [Candidatus Limnocylindria bacterium]